MYLKKCIMMIAAITAGSVILFSSSCKKDDASSSMPGSQENQMSAAVVSTDASSFTVTSSDGHLIGINGVQPVASTKGNTNSITGCGAATGLLVNAISGVYLSNGTYGSILANNWVNTGGACIALYINGVAYKDPTSGYSLWLASINGISAECRAISGGIQPGQTFRCFVRTYCSTDTTTGGYYDTPLTTYIVPSNFNSACGTTSGGTTSGGGGTKGGKGGGRK